MTRRPAKDRLHLAELGLTETGDSHHYLYRSDDSFVSRGRKRGAYRSGVFRDSLQALWSKLLGEQTAHVIRNGPRRWGPFNEWTFGKDQ